MDQPDEAEEWQTISDAVERRKVQNRINQRLSRQRRARNGGDAEIVIKQWTGPQIRRRILPSKKFPEDERIDPEDCNTSSESSTPESVLENEHIWKRLKIVDGEQCWLSPEELVLRRRIHCPTSATSISSDHLLTLIYLNVFRGLTWNIRLLGLDTEQMCVDEYPSPFLPCSPTASSAITKLPPGLKPTFLQRTVEHHPWIDIFPCPILRNNLVQSTIGDEEEEKLCVDILGLTGGTDEESPLLEGEKRRGATVWGDPWDIANWEVSRSLAIRWPWLFAGCVELQRATNRRRIARGWKPIYFHMIE